MARPESIALGGYFKTPTELITPIARLINTEPAWEKHNRFYGTVVIADPCAGDGEALLELGKKLFPNLHSDGQVYSPIVVLNGCELEADRADALDRRLIHSGFAVAHRHKAFQGDAFRLNSKDASSRGIDLLYLNPPYDQDPVYGRMEHRFLQRFTKQIGKGGVLVYVVPFYVLKTSARLLATWYENVHAFRFPEPHYNDFKQIVLVANRAAAPKTFVTDESAAVQQLVAMGNDDGLIPVLNNQHHVVALPQPSYDSFSWEMQEIDVQTLQEQERPFMSGTWGSLKPVRGLGLQTNITDMIGAKYPVIVPPRPTHVAVALASGLVNGREVQPDKTDSGLPPVMVKGVYRREFKTVEEKRNKDGELVAEIMVERPKLFVSILDTKNWRYYDLKPGITPSGAVSLSQFNIADLLRHYGLALADMMMEQCPPLHNPQDAAHDIQLPQYGLKPFWAQHHAIVAAVKTFFTTQHPFAGENPFVLGEVGTGKTFITLATADSLTRKSIHHVRAELKRIGMTTRKVKAVRRLLVMCPPHLLDGWRNEVHKIVPAAAVRILRTVADVDAAAAAPDDWQPNDTRPGAGLTVLIMSREMAKLGHSWGDGRWQRRCPKCGASFSMNPVDKLERCGHRENLSVNRWAKTAVQLAHLVGITAPDEDEVDGLVNGRFLVKYLRKQGKRYSALKKKLVEEDEESEDNAEALVEQEKCRQWLKSSAPNDKRLAHTFMGQLVAQVAADAIVLAENADYRAAESLVEGLLTTVFMSFTHPERDAFLLRVARKLYTATMRDTDRYGGASSLREEVAKLMLLVEMIGAQRPLAQELEALEGGHYHFQWRDFNTQLKRLENEKLTGQKSSSEITGSLYIYAHSGNLATGWPHNQDGQMVLGSYRTGLRLLRELLTLSEFIRTDPCGEPLYHAIPEPRRFPLATYIARRHPDLFDMLALDEAHEFNNDGTAQERAAHRLSEMGKPTLVLTGTSNNGYASSLFSNMWALSQRFRSEFDRGDVQGFVNRYGYRKVRKDVDDYKGSGFIGKQSDRTDTGLAMTLRKIGQAPGTMPLFIFKHLLTVAIPIHKKDLEADLPPMVEYADPVGCDDSMSAKYEKMRKDLLDQIMDDLRNAPTLAGKLWGQFAQLPTYLDRAHRDTGNEDDPKGNGRRYAIRYPSSVGGRLVTAADPLDADELVGKEEWLIQTVKDEIADNCYCLVFVWNTRSGLAERVERILGDAIGKQHVITLNPKVKATNRQEWIDKNVVAKRKKVMICNPKAVETGLNNLTYFSVGIWFQNPNANAIMYQQANDRLHRPGQNASVVRIYLPYYGETIQSAQFSLLAHKIAASQQTDGLDVTTALVAAGADIEDDAIDALSLGQAIYKLMQEGGGHADEDSRFKRKNGVAKIPTPIVQPKKTAVPPPLPSEAVGKQMRLLEQRAAYIVAAGGM